MLMAWFPVISWSFRHMGWSSQLTMLFAGLKPFYVRINGYKWGEAPCYSMPSYTCLACPKRVGDWDVPPGSGWWWLEMLRLFRLPKKCGWLSAGVALWRCKVPLTLQFFVVPSSQWLGWRALAQQQGRLGDWRTLGLSDPHLLIMAMVPRFRLMVYQLWNRGCQWLVHQPNRVAVVLLSVTWSRDVSTTQTDGCWLLVSFSYFCSLMLQACFNPADLGLQCHGTNDIRICLNGGCPTHLVSLWVKTEIPMDTQTCVF